MCRMIIAIGKFEAAKLLRDFIKMAKGENELHEKNTKLGSFMHCDGWGLAYMDCNGSWHTYKSTKPVYEDSRAKDFCDIPAKVLVLHARKATGSNIVLENTQPLNHKEGKDSFIFAHNGIVNDLFEIPETKVKGDSDSVKWFNHILCNYSKEDGFRADSEFYSLQDFSCANFIFVDGRKACIGQYYRSDPIYHTMKECCTEDMRIISSEVLPNYLEKRWSTLSNKSLIEIPLPN